MLLVLRHNLALTHNLASLPASPHRITPTGMIFIPCRNGWSHRPDEFSSASQIEKGVQVLALTMARLSGGSWPDSVKSEL